MGLEPGVKEDKTKPIENGSVTSTAAEQGEGPTSAEVVTIIIFFTFI